MKQHLLLCSLTFFTIVTVASCFKSISSKLEPVTIEESNFKCQSEGRFADPDRCDGYVECIRRNENVGGGGSLFQRRLGTCHGAIFSSEFKYCITSNQVHDCKRSGRSARALATDPRSSSICSKVRNGFVCADCKTAVNCVEGVKYTESCGAGDTCSEKENFAGAVCYPSQPVNCTCNNSPNEFHVDHYNPQMFFFCNNSGSDPDLYHCPGNMRFDLESKQCSNEQVLPECTQTGTFANYDNCSKYYTCSFGKDSWVQNSSTCVNDHFMYNEETGKCEDPCNWDNGDNGDFTCQQEGRFADPLNCQHYYECIQEKEESFRQEHRKCPNGTKWDSDAFSGKGHCMSGDVTTCKPVKVGKCFIPKDRCQGVAPPKVLAPPRYVCDGREVITQTSGILKAVSSGNYNNGTLCTWNLQMPSGSRISFFFSMFDLVDDDHVGLFDYSIQEYLGRFFGTTIPHNMMSSGNKVDVLFLSQSYSATSKGFHLHYQALTSLN